MRRLAAYLMIGLAWCWTLPADAADRALQNRLAENPSPYLALHGHDPVAWQEWNAETVARAKREGKLLFVSIGYFSCHWCHVMQRESYRDPEIAKLLNSAFVPVKVDREISGALDAQMQAFAEATRGQAGWPLNVFITPEGYPLVAILYAPPQDFLQFLTKLQARWTQDQPALAAAARSAAQEMPEPRQAEAKFAPQIAVLYRQRLLDEALAQADILRGGFGTVSKFPQAPQLMALLDIQHQAPQPKLAEFLSLTLDQMARLGLRDHVGGGFFRYTVDPDWNTPHFEKMLYDNAQLAVVYLRAATVLHEPRWRATAIDTLDFMLRDLRDEATGAFITSLSAIDTQNREGGAYLWDKAELKRLLTPADYGLLATYWRLDRPADSASGYLPIHHRQPTTADRKRLDRIYTRLHAERVKRAIPRDDKLLAGLNGLALRALSDAAGADTRLRAAARQVRDFLVERLVVPHGLLKGMAKGRALAGPTGQPLPADLDDYAYVSAGLTAYAALTQGAEDRELAKRIAQQAWDKFHTPRGWQLEQEALLARPYFQQLVPDGSSASPAAVLIQTSWQLGGTALRTHALSALNIGYEELDKSVFWFATQVSAMNQLQ